jgi:hypothetical protein
MRKSKFVDVKDRLWKGCATSLKRQIGGSARSAATWHLMDPVWFQVCGPVRDQVVTCIELGRYRGVF